MHLYQVGQPYHPGKKSWQERGIYQYRSNSHELLLFFKQPKPVEIEDVKHGDFWYALVTQEDLIMFLWKFGRIPWSDAPYSWHMNRPDERSVPPQLAETERALLHVVLVDADSGLILALREISLLPKFSQALHAAITNQIARPFDQRKFDERLAKLYRLYPSSESLLRFALAEGHSILGEQR